MWECSIGLQTSPPANPPCSWQSTYLQCELRSHHLFMLYFAPGTICSTLSTPIHLSLPPLLSQGRNGASFLIPLSLVLRHDSLPIKLPASWMPAIEPRVIGCATGFVSSSLFLGVGLFWQRGNRKELSVFAEGFCFFFPPGFGDSWESAEGCISALCETGK